MILKKRKNKISNETNSKKLKYEKLNKKNPVIQYFCATEYYCVACRDKFKCFGSYELEKYTNKSKCKICSIEHRHCDAEGCKNCCNNNCYNYNCSLCEMKHRRCNDDNCSNCCERSRCNDIICSHCVNNELICKRSLPITQEDFENHEKLKYSVCQYERCEKTGRLHIQYYGQLTEKMRFKSIKNIFGNESMHIEKAEGTYEEASNYCKAEFVQMKGTYGDLNSKNYKLNNGQPIRKRVEDPNKYFEFGEPNRHRRVLKMEELIEENIQIVNEELKACILVGEELTNGSSVKEVVLKYHKKIPSWTKTLQGVVLFEKIINQEDPKPFISKYTLDNFDVPESMLRWKEENLDQNPERPKSLLLIGESRKGKTEWARCLGKHVYWNGVHNLDKWDNDAEYVVMDDFTWVYRKGDFVNSNAIERWKPVIGCQKEFEMTDKFRHKQTCHGPKPCIILCNEDQDPRQEMNESFKKYFYANVEVISLCDRDIRKV